MQRKTVRVTLDVEMDVPSEAELAEWEAERGYCCATSYMARKDMVDVPMNEDSLRGIIAVSADVELPRMSQQNGDKAVVRFIGVKLVREP